MNNIYPTGKNGRRYLSQAGEDYAKAVWACSIQQRNRNSCSVCEPMKGRLDADITAHPPIGKARRDLDNILKALFDSLVKANVIEDDSLIDRISIRRSGAVNGGEVHITIAELPE